jgi:hypothetical protein
MIDTAHFYACGERASYPSDEVLGADARSDDVEKMNWAKRVEFGFEIWGNDEV